MLNNVGVGRRGKSGGKDMVGGCVLVRSRFLKCSPMQSCMPRIYYTAQRMQFSMK